MRICLHPTLSSHGNPTEMVSQTSLDTLWIRRVDKMIMRCDSAVARGPRRRTARDAARRKAWGSSRAGTSLATCGARGGWRQSPPRLRRGRARPPRAARKVLLRAAGQSRACPRSRSPTRARATSALRDQERVRGVEARVRRGELAERLMDVVRRGSAAAKPRLLDPPTTAVASARALLEHLCLSSGAAGLDAFLDDADGDACGMFTGFERASFFLSLPRARSTCARWARRRRLGVALLGNEAGFYGADERFGAGAARREIARRRGAERRGVVARGAAAAVRAAARRPRASRSRASGRARYPRCSARAARAAPTRARAARARAPTRARAARPRPRPRTIRPAVSSRGPRRRGGGGLITCAVVADAPLDAIEDALVAGLGGRALPRRRLRRHSQGAVGPDVLRRERRERRERRRGAARAARSLAPPVPARPIRARLRLPAARAGAPLAPVLIADGLGASGALAVAAALARGRAARQRALVLTWSVPLGGRARRARSRRPSRARRSRRCCAT